MKFRRKMYLIPTTIAVYHEGNISRLSDFDVFSLLDIRKRNK